MTEKKLIQKKPPLKAASMVEIIYGCKWSLTIYSLLRDGINRPGEIVRAACRLFLRNLPGPPSPRQGQKQATSMPPAALAVLVPLDFDPPSGLKIYAPQ